MKLIIHSVLLTLFVSQVITLSISPTDNKKLDSVPVTSAKPSDVHNKEDITEKTSLTHEQSSVGGTEVGTDFPIPGVPPKEPPRNGTSDDTTTALPTTTTTTPKTSTTPSTTTPSPSTTTPSPTTSAPPHPSPPPTSSTTLKPTSTVIPSTSTPNSTTVAPPAPTPPSKTDRKFDGLSFFAGFVMCTGLLAIGVVAYKFYEARRERNYHTL